MRELRDLFLIRPDLVYLNHGSQGACPRPVFEAYQARQLELERERITKHVLPKRHALAGTAHVFPVCVEIRLPVEEGSR